MITFSLLLNDIISTANGATASSSSLAIVTPFIHETVVELMEFN